MTTNSSADKQGRFERRTGFWSRNWLVVLLGFLSLVLLLVALAWWWLVPRFVAGMVGEMEQSMARIIGAPVVHDDLRLEGIDRLVFEGVALGPAECPLVRLQQVTVTFDAFAFTEGLPTVLLVQADGVQVRVVREGDGSDNATPILRAIAAYLARDRSGQGEASKLARLLRQTPAVTMSALSVAVEAATAAAPGEYASVLSLNKGSLHMENPNLSLREKAYLLDATFLEANGGSRAQVQCDVNIAERSAQLEARFSPPMYLGWQGQEMELEQVRMRSGEFVEVNLGRVALANPLTDLGLLEGLFAAVAPDQKKGLPERLAMLQGWRDRIDRYVAQTGPFLAQIGYPRDLVKKAAAGAEKMVNGLVRRLLSEADGERLVLDSARILYLTSRSASGAPVRKLKVNVTRGEAGGGEVLLTHRVEQGIYEARFDLVSPSRLFELSGDLEKDGDRVTARVDVAANVLDPFCQVRGTIGYDDGVLEGDFRAQVKNDDPPLTVSADLLFRKGQVTGVVEGEFLVPDLLLARRAKVTFQKGTWTADLSGTLFAPGSGSPVEVQAAFDSTQGIKRAFATSEKPVRIATGEYDLLLGRVRMGRDAVVHLEELSVVRKGASPDRAIVQVADLSLALTNKGMELVETLRNLDLSLRPETLLAQLVDSVEILQPVIEVRQPPRLPGPADAAETATADDLEAKMEDALQEGSGEAIVMHEPYRKALQELVAGTGRGVRSFIRTMLELGDRFPLQRVVIKEGKFRYSGGVGVQDRLLDDLSDFTASITKTQRAGNLGGTFTIEASAYSSAVDKDQATSRFTAEVDLGTGDLKGRVEVEKMALEPYRVFMPSMVVSTPTFFLEETVAGFHYQTETDRFRVWGRGRVADLNLKSRRIAREPIEHLTVDFSFGDDKANGLLFELATQKLRTISPIFVTFGKIQGLALEFSIDASIPDYPRFEVEARVPEVPVNDLLASIPRAMGNRLAGMQVSGRLGLTLVMAGDSRNLRDMTFKVTPSEENLRLEMPGRYVDFNKLTGAFKHRPPTDRKRTVWVGAGDKYVPLERISPWLVVAVTTTEDGSFFRHEGFNTYQLKMSVMRNLEKGRFVRGASTISMQLTKNLFLDHEKTLSRKLQEIILTWLMEREIRKDKLIEIYLNIIEWGDGIYGIKEACDYYFGGLPPDSLSPAHAAFLASFIPYPRPFSKRFAQGMFGEERSKRWNRWWKRRLKLVRRVVRAMVNNCDKVSSKCPGHEPYCRIMAATCRDPGRELVPADNLQDLDELFRPVEPTAPAVELPPAIEL